MHLRTSCRDIYEQKGKKLQVDCLGLPGPFDWKLHQPEGNLDITMANIFGPRYTARVFDTQLLNTK